jgi:hypothetical protein
MTARLSLAERIIDRLDQVEVERVYLAAGGPTELSPFMRRGYLYQHEATRAVRLGLRDLVCERLDLD